jgi:hypothetical protein
MGIAAGGTSHNGVARAEQPDIAGPSLEKEE